MPKAWHRCFLENFVKFLRTPFYTEHLVAASLFNRIVEEETKFMFKQDINGKIISKYEKW